LILGDGPDVELVHEFINENPNLINKIKLLGKVDNLYQILKFADVFLLPSEQESFGLAALEAMAAKLL
jgi:glycosyltransferase involved in cell wall biosynthesis